MQRPTPQTLSNLLGQPSGWARRGEPATPKQTVRTRGSRIRDAQHLGQPTVIAEFRVSVQRQVIGQQRSTSNHQGAHTSPLDPDQARRLALPEPAVMDQNRVGAGLKGRIQQGLARGYAGNQQTYWPHTCHLQAVWAVVVKAIDGQEFVAMAGKGLGVDHRSRPGCTTTFADGAQFDSGIDSGVDF
jgi:hypothetical protein